MSVNVSHRSKIMYFPGNVFVFRVSLSGPSARREAGQLYRYHEIRFFIFFSCYSSSPLVVTLLRTLSSNILIELVPDACAFGVGNFD